MFFIDKKHAILVLVAARSRLLAPLSTCPPPLCVTGFPTQRNALLPRCLSWRQRFDDLEGLLQVAPLFVLWSVPCRIRTPLVWWDTVCGCSPSGHCPCAYTRVGSAYRSTQVLRNWIRFFSLSQRWHRQEQKLLFTSLPWHVEQIGAFPPPTSLSGGCLEENAGDVVQSMAGRVLGRLLHLNGWGMEPHVLFASRRSTRVADLHVPPEDARCAASCVI